MIDLIGGLIRDARKAVYSGENLLSTGEKRYALINKRRKTVWLDDLNKRYSELAG